MCGDKNRNKIMKIYGIIFTIVLILTVLGCIPNGSAKSLSNQPTEMFEGSGEGSGALVDVYIKIDEGSGDGSGGSSIDISVDHSIIDQDIGVTTEISNQLIIEGDYSTFEPLDEFVTTTNHFSEENFTTIAPVLDGTVVDTDIMIATEQAKKTIEETITESPVFHAMYYEDISHKIHEVTFYDDKKRSKSKKKDKLNKKKKAKKAKTPKNPSIETTIDPFFDDFLTTPSPNVQERDIELVNFHFNLNDEDFETESPLTR